MKKKWIYIAVAALMMSGAVATAMAHKGDMGRRGPRAVMSQLNLSDEQKDQMKELRRSHRDQMEALRDGEEKPSREAMQAMFKAHREAMREILTEEQREKMDEMRGDWALGQQRGMRGHWGQRGGHDQGHGKAWGRDHRGQRGGRGVLSALDLSDEQKEKIKTLREKQREDIKELTQKHRASIEKVLTKAQREKLEQLKDEAFYGRGFRGGHSR